MPDLIPVSAVHAELKKQPPAKPYYVAQDQSFPLTQLSDRQFEILAHLLLEAERPNRGGYDATLLLTYGADEGRDVVLYSKAKPVGVVQCKRYARSIGMPDVLKELFKFLLFALRDDTLMPEAKDFCYAFWTARDLTKEAGKFFKEPGAYFVDNAAKLANHVAAARDACKSLKEASPYGTSHDEETRKVIEIARGLRFEHLGLTEISRLLLKHADVRGWFFRGACDVPVSPSVQQVSVLIERLTHQAIERFKQSGNLGTDAYVASSTIANDFTEFLESGQRLFVLTGGSGHGKTTWSANLLVSPPPGWSVVLVKGEDIADEDVNIAETLSRLLKANPLPTGLTGVDMTAAVWHWLDADNRLLLVDGLDRVPAHARAKLPTWIENSLSASAGLPARLILVSRNEEWGRISGRMPNLVFQPSHLGLLSDEEAQTLYRAYGLQPITHHRPVRTPSLIRRLSQLKHKFGGPVTRATLLQNSVGERKAALVHAHSRVSVERAFSDLSRALADTSDARIRLLDLQGSDAILDELIREDILISEPPWLRPESDDVAEYLIALELDCDKALMNVAGGRSDAIFLGAIAIAPHLFGREAELDPLIEAVLPKIGEATGTWFELAARIMIEVEDHSRYLPVLHRIVGAWKWTNLALFSSNLHELLDDLRLPFADRFDLLMRIADQEDEDDWRWKFWLEPETNVRMATPFGTMICDMVRTHPIDSLPLLERLLMQAGDSIRRAIGSALLFESASAALPDTLLCCVRLGEVGNNVTANLATLYPLGFARYALGRARESATAIDDIVDDFCKALVQALANDAPGASIAEWTSIIDELLSLGGPGRARQRLLLCSLTIKPDRQYLDELFNALDALDWSDIWWLVKLAGEEADVPLRAIFSGVVDKLVPFGCLARLDPFAVPSQHWPLVARLMEELIVTPDPTARRAASEATEMILRMLERAGGGPYRMFMEAARKLAADTLGNVRGPLLYYSTGVVKRHLLPADVQAFRHELVALLAQAEDGTTLDTLRQKLYTDDSNDPFNAKILSGLELCFGPPSLERQELYNLLSKLRRT